MTAPRTGIAATAAWGLAACGAAPDGGPNLDAILADTASPRLSDYGLFADDEAREAAPRVVAYDLINPLFSDHAVKDRRVFVPEGETATYSEDGVFDFPVGTVLTKTFAFAPDMRQPDIGAYKVETRVLIRKTDGWAAYPYIWNDSGTEATYAPAGARRSIETIDPTGAALTIAYAVPNRNQCKTCHQAGDAIAPIGPKARNLNHPGPYGVNQLDDWRDAGILSAGFDQAPASVAVADVGAPLDARARAYLDINCAHCHKADGSASNTGLWLEAIETEPVRIGFGKRPTAAGRGAGHGLVVIEPGAPDASILTYRMASAEAGVAMPELGRSVIDADGLALVRDWIASLEPETAAANQRIDTPSHTEH